MSNRKKLKDLTIRDNFMFAAVMMQGDNCKHFLEMVLGIEIARIEISYEKSIIYNPECKGVRLDVFAKNEDNTCYDIEMQVETGDSYVKQIQNTIRSLKESREMECRYQFAGDMLVREYKKGKLEGRLEAKRSDILELLEEFGTVSEHTYERIMSENRIDTLRAMLKVAAKADSLEQFEELISNL